MVFNSLSFFVFLALCLLVYRVLPHRAQNVFLVLASYFFYGAWDWRFLGLIWFSTVFDWAMGLSIARSGDPRRRRLLLGASIAASLCLLGFFKYVNFFSESFAGLVSLFGVTITPFELAIVLPAGISFYTFKTMSYVIDVYRGRLAPEQSLLAFALYVAFFPTLVAGPIERAGAFLPQVHTPRRQTLEKFSSGAWLILWGLFKKAVIGDNLAWLTDAVYAAGSQPTGPEVLMASWAFGIQIYCDFSGYSDIARGLARLFGFELMLNFRLPYFATNIADFWTRWHISLSSWLRDYVYIPLGGNRLHQSRNLFVTMVLCGLWHGAGWNYVLFGVYHGFFSTLHRRIEGIFARATPAGRIAGGLWTLASVILTFQLVSLAWPIFRAPTIARSGELLLAVATDFTPGLVTTWALPFTLLCAPLLAFQLVQWWRDDLEPVGKFRFGWRVFLYAAVAAAIVLFGEDYGEPFIYFQF
jgi:D-alanyl-lipoteichoic acid acyltransferase DltB (MBOAT superfamily)